MKQSLFCLCLFFFVTGFLAAQNKPVDPVPVPGKNTWPAKDIPAVIPEYKAKVANYGNGGEKNWFLIYMVETDAQKVDDYARLYQNAGWKLTKEKDLYTAEKDQYVVFVQFYPASKLVGITIKTLSTQISWPTKEFPSLPIFTKCQSASYTKNEYDWTIDVKKVQEEDMKDYIKALLKAGWEGEAEGSEFSWNKTKPELSLQINDQGQGLYYFSVSEK